MNDEEKYVEYEKVRRSGVTNMFDINTVSILSGLSKEDIIYVMNNYTKLNDLYKDKV